MVIKTADNESAKHRNNLLRKGLFSDLWILGKPRITGMVLLSTAVGYLLGGRMVVDGWLLSHLLLATWLLGSGVNALNQYLERDTDALMTRTKDRPLPSKRMRPMTVVLYGLAASLAGIALLATWTNDLATMAGILVVVSYVAIYTPLKRLSPFNTWFGSIPGAVPPLLGWVAASGTLDLEAWALFLILFCWQPTHFMPIAYKYKDEYKRAGLAMLTLHEQERAKRVMILYTVVLIPLSVYPAVLGLVGDVYVVFALLLGVGFLSSAVAHGRNPSQKTAMMHLKVSVIYLPLLLGLMLFDLKEIT